MSVAAISVQSLSKHYGATHAVNDVNFEIARGEFAVLLGPSGSGKTTMLSLIAALAGHAEPQGPGLPKVLFFANPMTSDNDVIRRPRPETLSVAERHFVELSKGVFEVTITQDGAEVTRIVREQLGL